MAHIIFCEMVGDQWLKTTNFSIGPVCGDGNDRVLVVDCKHRRIGVGGRPRGYISRLSTLFSPAPPEPRDWWSFDEFLGLDPDRIWDRADNT
jgi:hypothetical protein